MLDIARRVLYEDNHLIVINKPAGALVQGDKTGDNPLSELVRAFIKEKYNKPGNVFTGVVHRLDRPVSGVLLFAKTSKALERLNELFRLKTIKKTYWAIVKTKPKNKDHLIHYLIRDRNTNTVTAYDREIPKGEKAELSYSIIREKNNFYLLEVTLITGKHHQIRAQLAHIGSPIVGDLKYGFGSPNKNGSIHLHAKSIEFIHPIKKEPLKIEAPLPDDEVWKLFH